MNYSNFWYFLHVIHSSISLEKYKIMLKLLSDPMTLGITTILSGGSSPPTTLEKVGKYDFHITSTCITQYMRSLIDCPGFNFTEKSLTANIEKLKALWSFAFYCNVTNIQWSCQHFNGKDLRTTGFSRRLFFKSYKQRTQRATYHAVMHHTMCHFCWQIGQGYHLGFFINLKITHIFWVGDVEKWRCLSQSEARLAILFFFNQPEKHKLYRGR